MKRRLYIFIATLAFSSVIIGCAGNIISSPLDQFPEVSQFNTSAYENHFVEQYKIDFPRSDVIGKDTSLQKCLLPQERLLKVTNLSKSVLAPEYKSENQRGRTTVSHGKIELYSTIDGCDAISRIKLKKIKSASGKLINKLPTSFRHPLYFDATYTIDKHVSTFINNRWHSFDYGTDRVRIKKYRHESGLEGNSVIEKIWTLLEPVRHGDYDSSRYSPRPMYSIKYYSDNPGGPDYVQLTRQTFLYETSNSITASWSDNGTQYFRKWSSNGSVVTSPHGFSKVFIPRVGFRVTCGTKVEQFSYFRVTDGYECIKAAKSDYGLDGVYYDESAVGTNEHIQELAESREENERKAKEVAEKKRLAEINERKRRAKVAVIQAYINQNSDLTAALSDIVQVGTEKQAVGSILQKNRFGAEECETRVGGEYFKSNACESSWETLMSSVKSHYSSLNATYRKQRDRFSNLFGNNASLVESLVDERVADAPSADAIERQYAPAFRQLRRITKAEASAERSARQRQEQQMMADFMNNIQNTLEKTNRMLDRNMAQTRKTINQAYASRRSSGNYEGSNPQVRSNTPAMRKLDKKLEEIDRSFSTNNGTKDLPDIGSAPVKPSYRVCGGPFTVSAMNQVFDIKAINSGKAEPPIECSAGGSPVMAGNYHPNAQYINWLMRPPNYRKEALRNENGRPSGRFRVSWDAFSYECLCSNSSGGQRSGSYQQ